MMLALASLFIVQEERCNTAISDYLTAYMGLFIGRQDDYAIQLPDGRYRRVGKPLERFDVHDHLLGIRSYGTYVINEKGLCQFAVFDADTQENLQYLWKLHKRFMSFNYPSYMESSRRGGHLWIFFVTPIPASRVRAWLVPLCPQGLELYPKQDEGKGYGSLIRLPLGRHQRSGKRYPFVERLASGVCRVAPTFEDTLAWLNTIQRVNVPQQEPHNKKVTPHTHTSFSLSPLSTTPQRPPTSIRAWCAQHDPFVFLSRYIDLNSTGVGQCPFPWHHSNSDTHASFKVYRPGVPGGYCWYCYAWQQGGSLFDFLRYYYQLDASTLWHRIQTGSI